MKPDAGSLLLIPFTRAADRPIPRHVADLLMDRRVGDQLHLPVVQRGEDQHAGAQFRVRKPVEAK